MPITRIDGLRLFPNARTDNESEKRCINSTRKMVKVPAIALVMNNSTPRIAMRLINSMAMPMNNNVTIEHAYTTFNSPAGLLPSVRYGSNLATELYRYIPSTPGPPAMVGTSSIAATSASHKHASISTTCLPRTARVCKCATPICVTFRHQTPGRVTPKSLSTRDDRATDVAWRHRCSSTIAGEQPRSYRSWVGENMEGR